MYKDYSEAIRAEFNRRPLTCIVEDYIRNTVSQQIPDRNIRQICLDAALKNVYFSDDNEINTLEQLKNRAEHSYAPVYSSLLSELGEDAESVAYELDMAIRASLTMLGLLCCVECNEFGKLDYFIQETLPVVDKDKQYAGCMIVCRNGVVFNTVTGFMQVSGSNVCGFVPDPVNTDFHVCIGYPCYMGDRMPCPEIQEVICEEPDFLDMLNQGR